MEEKDWLGLLNYAREQLERIDRNLADEMELGTEEPQGEGRRMFVEYVERLRQAFGGESEHLATDVLARLRELTPEGPQVNSLSVQLEPSEALALNTDRLPLTGDRRMDQAESLTRDLQLWIESEGRWP